jgi:hypothetical protein
LDVNNGKHEDAQKSLKKYNFFEEENEYVFFWKEETFDIDIYKMYTTKVDWIIQLYKMKSLFKNVHYFNQILASTNKFCISTSRKTCPK